jgi:hypothetical protein
MVGYLVRCLRREKWGNVMMRTLIAVFSLVLVLGTARAADPEVAKVAERAISAHALMVGSLRNDNCGGDFGTNQDAKNAAFAACVMYVLGAVDMISEWQRNNPAHAPTICLPRTITAGGLILAVQEHLEATTPWRKQQFDAAPAVLAALASKWPCSH